MILLMLPAYNEEKSLPLLLERYAAVAQANPGDQYRALVINDGSSDRTAEVAQWFTHLPLRLINHDGNKGLGEAMKTGLSAAAQMVGPGDTVVTMDADNTHDPALIPQMRERQSRGYDLVIASRYQKGGREVGLSPARHIFSRGASWLLHLFFPIAGVRDYTCGFRAYSGELLQRAIARYGDRLVEERGFTCMAEILIKMARCGARVDEVPLVLRYDLKEGASKMKVGRTISRYAVLIARNRLP